MNKKERWLNLANYHFEGLVPNTIWHEIKAKFSGNNPFTLAFADKLCRKYGWKKRFALLAIWEYKKFVYLGVISPGRVTPSKAIDMVWHEHLLFSAGYRHFCNEVIYRNFDHHPELVGLEDLTETFQQQYEATLALYQDEFGIIPPPEIWGKSKFSENIITRKRENPRKGVGVNGWGDSDPLFAQLSAAETTAVMFGGGDFGGGGGGSEFGDGDSGDSDGGDSGGGTSCSSSCGSCGGGD